MYASITVEAIGHDEYQRMRLYSGIMGECGLGNLSKSVIGNLSDFKRWSCIEVDSAGKFVASVRGRYDYRQSNSKGSRGVMCTYVLQSGKTYRVKSPLSWGYIDTFLVTVTEAGNVIRH